MTERITVSIAVARALTQWGIERAFGVAGSGNFDVTNAMIDAGATYVAARHEGGATTMADGFARTSRQVTVASVHQGPGFTNALTGLAEAVKVSSRLLVLAAETPATAKTSNFWIDQARAAESLGAIAIRLESPDSALLDAAKAVAIARTGKPVVLGMPLDVQAAVIEWDGRAPELPTTASPSVPPQNAVAHLASRLGSARRPLIVAGRGALEAHEEVTLLAATSKALLATTAQARGLFNDDPWNVDVMGGFANEAMAELIKNADLIVAIGASLNRWTTRNGELVRAAEIWHVDINPSAFGKHRPADMVITGDAALVATAVTASLKARTDDGYRTDAVAHVLRERRLWRDQPFAARDSADRIDPRTLAIELDEMLPPDRLVTADAGSHTEYSAMYLQVPDSRGYCLPLGFQCIGLALAASIGAALAQPNRLPVVGIGDGGFMMSLVELDTAVRLCLPLVVIVYNDSAYGAEIHHFIDSGQSLDIVRFPETDIAAIARGFGCEGITVRSVEDLAGLRTWLAGDRSGPIVVDAKTVSFPSWVDAHAFVGEHTQTPS